MDYIKGRERNQITLLPDCIDDLVGQDNPVHVINAFVNGLDLTEVGIKRATPNETGRPSYDPRDLLKLYVYGYFNKIRSSRKLMTECTRNIELFFLLNRLTPDFRTIADFRKDSTKALKNAFREKSYWLKIFVAAYQNGCPIAPHWAEWYSNPAIVR